MAIGFDVASYPPNALYNATFSWTHTPSGTPRGVAVAIVQEGTTDQVSAVTYGGVGMTRVRSDVRSTAEAGRTYLYFLGSGVLTGARTVQVTLTSTQDCNAACLTVTATDDTSKNTEAGGDAGVIANPSLAISPTVATVILYGYLSGLNAPITTVEAGSTHIIGKDLGVMSAMFARKSVSAGATTIGYTAASDDVCHSALAIQEGIASTTYPITLTATAIGVATYTDIATHYRALPATAIGVGVLADVATHYRVLAATAVGAAVMTFGKLYSKALAAVAVGVATLARVPTYVQAMAATAVGVAVLSRVATFYRALAATAVGQAVTARKTSKTMAATAIGVPVMDNTLAADRDLTAVAVGVATMGKAITFKRTLAAVAQGVATLAKVFIAGGGGS